MKRIKKNLYLCRIILFNIIVITLSRYGYSIHHNPSFDSIFFTICMIAPRYILLPLNCFFIARKFYSSHKKWISIVSTILIYLSFLCIIEPGGIDPIFGGYVGLYRYDWIRNASEMFPFFSWILAITFIIGGDMLFRYISNQCSIKIKNKYIPAMLIPFLAILIFFGIWKFNEFSYYQNSDSNPIVIENNETLINKEKQLSFDERLTIYIQSNFSKGYGCDDIKGSQYFFDIQKFPYQKSGTYLVRFGIEGYSKTKLNNLTSCGGGGENLIVQETGGNITTLHIFPPVQGIEEIPLDIQHILRHNELPNTRYQQAKIYFEIKDRSYGDQSCISGLCDKTWYSIINGGDADIMKYTTIPPKELKENGGWRTLYFGSDHTMKESNHSCPNSKRCINTGIRENTNKQTISYPLDGSSIRKNNIEILKTTNNELEIRNLYR